MSTSDVEKKFLNIGRWGKARNMWLTITLINYDSMDQFELALVKALGILFKKKCTLIDNDVNMRFAKK